MEKKIRFRELVGDSGKPEIVTLWTEPNQDRRFMRAVRHNQVLTIFQQLGTKKRDYGEIGFKRHAQAAYLVFPRPLPRAGRVIGIEYNLIREPEVTDPVRREDGKRQPRATKARPAKAKPSKRKFTVRVRRTARREDSITVEALDQGSAEREAVEAVKREPFGGAEVKAEVVK